MHHQRYTDTEHKWTASKEPPLEKSYMSTEKPNRKHGHFESLIARTGPTRTLHVALLMCENFTEKHFRRNTYFSHGCFLTELFCYFVQVGFTV